jgi:hypothetical protein
VTIRTIPRNIRPEGCPITLHVPEHEFSGTDATDCLTALRIFTADKIIPHIPFVHADDEARKRIRAMSNVEFVSQLNAYVNAHNGPDATDYPDPDTDDEAVHLLVFQGIVRIQEEPL